MNTLGHWILTNTAWLYTKIFESAFFFLDLWSFVHLWSGFMVMTGLLALRVRRPWLLLAGSLLAYELVELGFIYAAFHAFHPETLKDQATDIVIGALGAAGARMIQSKAAAVPHLAVPLAHRVAAVLVPLTLAFVWVGHYGYRYDREALNSPGLNGWAFSLWTLALLLVAYGFTTFESRWESTAKALSATAILYALSLFVVEYVGSVILGIHEVGHATRKALVFDLVHGTPTMHAFYLAAPFTTVAALVPGRALLGRAFAVRVETPVSSVEPIPKAFAEGT